MHGYVIMTADTTILTSAQEQIVAGKFEAALQSLHGLLQTEPENGDALYMCAVCHRYLKQYDAALAELAKLKRLAPGNGRAHQEEGHSYRAIGNVSEALKAYARATYYNPALMASYKAQLELLSAGDNVNAMGEVKRQLDALQKLPKPLLAVMDLIAESKLLQAEELCRKFLQKVPHNVEGMRLLAEIGIKLGVLEDAEYLLESAVEFEPDNVAARIDYIQALRKRQKFFAALEQAKILLAKDEADPKFRSIYAVECMQTGDFDAAIANFRKILERLPEDPVTLTSLGHAQKTRGDFQEAVDSYLAALKAHPYHGEAYYSLANLKTYKFTAEEIAEMRAVEQNSNLAPMDQVYLNFALGKAYEDNEDYKQSFECYASGNKLKKAQSRYKADVMTGEFEEQRRICTPELFARNKNAGCPAPDPIFILGLPRAGSTLLEQILSSHSQVDGTLELPNILSLSQRLRRRSTSGKAADYPEILEQLSEEELTEFGEEYIRDTRVHRSGAPFFIDKMPNNFRHIGLIKLILPNARIIDARRDAMACCFSGFKQLFAEGQEFSYSLTDIGLYYRDYVRLMAHWDEVLPGQVLRMQNEDLIEDFENQVRRMLDFCGLPFEESCLRYYETKRNIRTPSSEQVRQPISRAGVDQWRNYAEFLQPLEAALASSQDDSPEQQGKDSEKTNTNTAKAANE